MAPYFQNQSCDPFTSASKPCELGNYLNYAINVTGASDVQAGLKFAQDSNVRIVIKNTGHDLLGKSSGADALGLWTHNLKSINFFDYQSPGYTGKAVKLGAGVQAYEAYTAANAQGMITIGGWCPTVGLAGGFSSGGGHSPMSSTLGLSADSVLEWEVVTADGTHLTASPQSNEDLYWALTGGGAGTFAVVLSMTTKAYTDRKIGAVSLVVPSANVSYDKYWGSVAAFHSNLPSITDNQGEAAYLVSNQSLDLLPISFPDKTEIEMRTIIKPMTDYLDSNKVPYQLNVTVSNDYLDHVKAFVPGFPLGEDHSGQVTGSHMFPRQAVETKNKDLVSALQLITSNVDFYVIGTGINVAYNVSGLTPGHNGVNPAWRDTLIHYNVAGTWDYHAAFAANQAKQDLLTNTYVPALQNVSPGTGSYLNEANFEQPDWQQTFYGTNYPRLLSVKNKYDPGNLLYAKTAVGSEAWTENPSTGALCRGGS